ncbi:TatD family hydrolase [Mycoplasma sp. CSL10137]|uniref:TatD family hydrolase n=1 Tax=unclassified Mycoplasma TaxID=2683645 RepID=UPI00197C7383|nr:MULTISPECIES: TatD family hydrolase [unclassified Mycoplasma]MBN4083584.1 TatD family hydrolase [Mycoplasma sp. CSL10137]MBU4692600.1 TatD family hydrolase [Mycoplasma sp. CSL7491-lung]
MGKRRNKFIDAHAHVNYSYYTDFAIQQIVEATEYNKVEFIINNGGHFEENDQVIELSKKYPLLKACIGIHPESIKDTNSILGFKDKVIENLDNIVGIGEIGIDYYYSDGPNRDDQIYCFEEQIKIANEYNLPAVIHIRDKENEFQAYQDVYQILQKYKNLKIMLHTFAGNIEWAQKFMEFKNLYFSFSGVVTFNSSENTRQVVKFIPLERILTETDSPYLRPHPYTGEKNEPNTVVYTSYYISALKGVGLDKFVDKINRNLRRLFNL